GTEVDEVGVQVAGVGEGPVDAVSLPSQERPEVDRSGHAVRPSRRKRPPLTAPSVTHTARPTARTASWSRSAPTAATFAPARDGHERRSANPLLNRWWPPPRSTGAR